MAIGVKNYLYIQNYKIYLKFVIKSNITKNIPTYFVIGLASALIISCFFIGICLKFLIFVLFSIWYCLQFLVLFYISDTFFKMVDFYFSFLVFFYSFLSNFVNCFSICFKIVLGPIEVI